MKPRARSWRRWKGDLPCPGSGGWGKAKTKDAAKEVKAKDLPLLQLYDMEKTISQK
jgi:hypothetical protein